MNRTALLCTVAALVAVAAGCRMCCHPHDYCGPTYTRGSAQSCCPTARSGSVLSEPINPACGIVAEPSFDGQIPAEQIISVTDEKVGTEQLAGRPPVEVQSVRAGVRMLRR